MSNFGGSVAYLEPLIIMNQGEPGERVGLNAEVGWEILPFCGGINCIESGSVAIKTRNKIINLARFVYLRMESTVIVTPDIRRINSS